MNNGRMREFFIVANSFAAPFVSDTSTHYVSAETPGAALKKFAAEYTHPAGLYSANLYENADAYHKKAEPLGKWRSNASVGAADPKEGSIIL